MISYKIFYEDILIGFLDIKEGLYKYTPEFDGILKIKSKVSLIPEMLVKSDWQTPIPFFQNRIKNATKFSNQNDITTHTDLFRMIKCN